MKKVLTLVALVMALSACSGQQANTQADPVNVSSLGKSEITDIRAADPAPSACDTDAVPPRARGQELGLPAGQGDLQTVHFRGHGRLRQTPRLQHRP